MNEIKNILVIADPTASRQPAVDKASALATSLGASIELVACRQDGMAADLRAWLEGLAVPLRDRGLDVTTSPLFGDSLHETLLRWIGNSPADLAVKDTHHHSMLKRTLLGNTDWHLIRDCPKPLLLVKPAPWRNPAVVAAAIDPHVNDPDAFLDDRILECASAISRSMKAQLHVVNVYFPAIIAATASSRTPSLLAVTPEMLDAERTLHRMPIGVLSARHGVLDANVHVEPGTPTEALPRIAEQYRFDMVVLGALSRSHLKQAVIGSAAERAIEQLPCDALLVKLPSYEICLPA